MIPYLITFAISFICCWLGEKWLRHGSSKFAKFFFVLAVLIVAILAGIRDINIGSDTISYTTYMFDYGKDSFHDFASYFAFFTQSYEPGFVIFSYIVRVFFVDSHWLLFWAAVVIYGFTLASFLRYKKQCSVSLAWILFLMLTCTEAFNIIRQYMAFAIGTYSFHFALEKKHKSFIFWVIVASSFHYGAIIFVPLYFVYLYIKKNGIVFKSVSIIAMIIFLAAIFAKLSGYIPWDFLAEKLKGYSDEGGGFIFQVNPFLIRLPFLILIFAERNLFIEGTGGGKYISFPLRREADLLILMTVIELLMAEMRGINVVMYRFTNFFALFRYISYSRVISVQRRSNRLYMNIFAIVYIMIVFVYWVAVLNSAHVYPYTSKILGIG